MNWLIPIILVIFGILVYLKNFRNPQNKDRREFLNVKEIVFSPHAIQRIHERGISEEEVLKIVNDRNSIVKYRFGNRFSLTDGKMTVVLSNQLDKLVIITVYWNRKRNLISLS